METVVISHPGDVSSLVFETKGIPTASSANLVVRVRAIGINRADSLQRQGLYPMPPGLGNVPGLELAGEVEAIGPDVQRYKVGDRVFALVAEGAYAEYCLVDEGLALPIPPNWNFAKAAAVMEVACTTNETVFELGELKAEQTILVHAGASGVGTTAIQMAKSVGAQVLFTAGSQEKIDLVCSIGGDMGINYHVEDFVDSVVRTGGNRGVDLIQDLVGGDYLMRNINLLRNTGRLVLVGALRGAKTEFDIELASAGEKKINVIKVIREITSLGLKEAKDLVDGAPSVVREAVGKDECEEIKKKLEEAGATVNLK